MIYCMLVYDRRVGAFGFPGLEGRIKKVRCLEDGSETFLLNLVTIQSKKINLKGSGYTNHSQDIFRFFKTESWRN